MELVLVDESNTNFKNSEPRGYSFNLTKQINIRAGSSTTHPSHIDFVKQVVSEITGKMANQPSTLSLNLTKTDLSGSKSFLYILIHSNSSFNVLNELRERFKENVNVFVSIKSSTVQISTEDMQIGDKNICAIGLFTNVDTLDELRSPLRVRITAQISADALVHETPLSERNAAILDDALSSDIIITAGNGKEVKAHKCFLMVFRTMFEVDMKEAKTGKVDMKDMSEVGVKAFLRYIYSNERIEPSQDISVAFELLCAGHKYHISGLEAVMISHLLERKDEDFSAKLALEIYTFVKNLESASAEDLKAKMMDVFHLKLDELDKLPEYKDLFKNQADSEELCKNLLVSLKRKSENAEHDSSSSKLKKLD